MHNRLRWLTLLVCCTLVGKTHAQRPDPAAGLVERLERQGGRVIVGLRPAGGRGVKQPGIRAVGIAEAARIAESLRPLGFTPRRQFRSIAAVSGTVAPAAFSALRAHPNVAYVQPDYPNRLVDGSGAPMTETTPYGIAKIRAPEAWAAPTPTRAGEGVKVGIMDTGGDSLHQDLRYAGGYDVLTGSTAASAWADTLTACHGHGTHVGGTVAARGGNDLGVVGVAPAAELYALKIFETVDWWGTGDYECLAFTSTIVSAFDWAIHNGIQVINMSFGKSSYDEAEHQAIQAAVAQGIVLVGAAGNSGGPVGYPAANPEVIAVAATDEFDARADFSSYGPAVDVAAPGVSVYSTLPNNQYDWYSGTSMASPHVTGLAALLRSINPTLTVANVRTYITAWAVDLGPLGVDDGYGFGRVDALASVTALIGPSPPTLSSEREPGGGVWGLPLTQQPVLQLVDAGGQPIAQAGVPVSATIVSGPGWLQAASVRPAGGPRPKGAPPAQVQAQSVVTDANGRAEFTNLTVSGAGTHVLEFSAPGHVAVRSLEFEVTIPPPRRLENGVAVTGVSGTVGSIQYWVLTVPPEAVTLTITTGDGWGDVDLYVLRDSPPDLGYWQCRSWSYTTSEWCTFSDALAGEWYVMLHAWDSFGDVTLRGEWRPAQVAAAFGIVRQPGNAPVGQPLQPQPVIELRDQQNQPVLQPGVTVTVVANRAGILTDGVPPLLEAVTDAQGRATFDGLLFTEQGVHALIFSAPGLVSVTSANVAAYTPLPAMDVIAQELVGSDQVTPAHEAYLDALGNADGVFNLGDFLAYRDRALAGSGTVAVPAPIKRATGTRRLP